jgi:hypothetical protein
VVLHRPQHAVGQGLQGLAHCGWRAAGLLGPQAQHEAGLLQRVGHVVAALEQAQQRLPLRVALGLAARAHHQMVGLAFPGLGAGSQVGGGRGVAVVAVGQGVAQALGHGVAQAGMLGQVLEAAMAALQALGQQGAHLVGHQGRRLRLCPGPVGQGQGLDQKGRGGVLAHHLVQAVAQAEGTGALGGHGVPDQALAAQREPGQMAHTLARGGVQHRHRGGLVDEGQQALAGPVPVDQEDDALADAFEHLLQRGLVGRGEAGAAHVVGLTGVQARGLPALGGAPLCAHLGQQALEEGEALTVQVGVGQADAGRGPPGVHLQHDDVGVVGADVVLDHQARALAGGRGVQARVLALERAGALQTAHEGLDARPVAAIGGQIPGMGAGHVVAGQAGGQAVERLVQVHHQAVQAVAGLGLAAGQRAQQGLVQQGTARGQGLQPGLPAAHPFGQRRVGIGLGQQRAGHHPQVLVQLPGQVQQGLVRRVGMGGRGLQHAEVELEPVVGAQGRPQAGRLQQRGPARRGGAQLVDGFVLVHRALQGSNGRSLGGSCDAAVKVPRAATVGPAPA